MSVSYDVVIIGAGLAGLNAGLRLTSKGLPVSVLLIDKAVPWERPIPCAEGVGRLGFEEALEEVDPSWIRLSLRKAAFYSPDGTRVTYTAPNMGYIIDRAKMQRDLADKLRARGADVTFGVKAVEVSLPNTRLDEAVGHRYIRFESGGGVTARVVIDASGPVSMLGKGHTVAGRQVICWKPYDLEPAYLALADNVDCDEDAVHLYFGQKVAPGGYAWAFPRGGGAANIGVVVGRKQVKGVNIKDLLDDFISKNFPRAKVLTRFAGSIPCGYKRGNIARPGFIKCGDAANTVNPISRSGISEALISGNLAADAAADMLGFGDSRKAQKDWWHAWENTEKICRAYEKAWFDKRGARHLKLAKVKDSMAKVPDEDYDNAAKAMQKLSTEKVSMAKIFGMCLGRFPRLVWALRHLM